MNMAGNLALPSNEPMTRSRKAALIVQMMLADGQKLALDSLPEEHQLRLTHEVAALRMVDKATIAAVAEEFVQELSEVGLALPGGPAAAVSALDGQISPTAMARFREETGSAATGDPWPRLIEMEADELMQIMEAECTEVCAVVLSKLPVGKAAELLGRLPGDKARRIAYGVSQTGDIAPTAVQRIGGALAETYVSDKVTAFPAPAGARVGAILNSTKSETREDVLEGLGEEDPNFAQEVRKNIFTFPDIALRLQPTDVAKVIRLVENDEFVIALAYGNAVGEASAESVTFMLENISKRMASQLEEEMAEQTKIKAAVGEAAQNALISALRDCAERGEITLIDPDEEDEE